MLEILVFFLFIFVFFALLYGVVTLRPMPISGALAIAFAGFVGLESIILNSLSIFHSVTRFGVLNTHLIFLFITGLWIGFYQRKFSLFRFGIRLINISHRIVVHPAFIFLSPFLIILALTTLVNAPTTWDSLTYHMARVAHWINNGSVDYYFTSITRQNEMSPGAEYLILFFLILTGQDILAGLPQLVSFLLLPWSLYYILRVFKVPASLIPYLILLTVSTPMAVLQATTTQNDLICAMMTFAIIISSFRLLTGSFHRLRPTDFAFIGLSLGAGWLVKPVSILVAAPFLLVGVGIQLPSVRISWKVLRQVFCGLLVTGIVIAITAGPDIFRKLSHMVSRGEVYPLFSGWTVERFLNPISTLVPNMPWPEEFAAMLWRMGIKGELFTRQVFHVHNDYIGSPIQQLLLMLFTAMTLLLVPFGLKYKKRLFPYLLVSLCPFFAWIVFSVIVKNQGWITRLQLPLFLVFPFAVVFVTHLFRQGSRAFQWYKRALVAVTIFSLSYGAIAATTSRTRPLPLKYFWGLNERKISYEFDRHNDLMRKAEEEGCTRIGMWLGKDTPDYNLTWRARERGMITRHISRDTIDGWPCLMYVEVMNEETPEAHNYNWISSDNYTWYRDLEYEFNRSVNTFLDMSEPDRLLQLQPFASSDVIIQRSPDGIVISAADNDPAILLPEIMNVTASSAILEIVMYSPVKSDAQVFYRFRGDNAFSEKRSITKSIEKGINRLYFFIPVSEIHGSMRLDVGRMPGNYQLSSIRCRSIATH